MKTKFIFITFFLCMIFLIFGTIINVPDDYATIQSAINASSTGDTILVQPGTYHENVDFNNRAVTLASLYATTSDESYIESTIINGGHSSSCVKFDSGEGNDSVINGFTVTNGYAYYGAGIYCYNSSSPTIMNMIIDNNDGHPDDSYGGGICIMSESEPVCSNIVISNNYAEAGGGIYCHDNGNATLSNITFFGNTANHGGAMLTNYSHPVVDRALIYDNQANSAGGAVYVLYHSFPEFTNCSIVNNTTPGWGGGFYCNDIYGEPIITNSIIWGNESDYDLQIFALGANPTVNYSDVQDGTGEDWFGEGCIDADPLFLDPGNDIFFLTVSSPCIDAGDPNSPLDPDGSIADMGVFYFEQTDVNNEELINNNERIEISNYPNPFHSSTTISFSVTQTSRFVTLDIYNLKGQKIRQFSIDDSRFSIVWDGTDETGKYVSSGIYYYKMKNGRYTSTKKMILMK